VRAVVLANEDVGELDAALLDGAGHLRLLPAEEFKRWTHNQLMLWCVQRARYCVPTAELVMVLRNLIGGRSALEVAAGHGDIGRHLGIRMTDSAMQCRPEVREHYATLGQPTIDPPPDVERLDANAAVRKYKPEVVVASWLTQRWRPGDDHGSIHGADEREILKRARLYVHIGNDGIHGKKRVCFKPHRVIKAPWLLSRSGVPEENAIYVWGK